jgi:hypothetical protein
VQRFLDGGGWWLVIGAVVLVALLWLRGLWRRLSQALRRRRRKKARPRKIVPQNLREDLTVLGEGFTEEGPQQVTVKGLPARLRLAVLAAGSRDLGALDEEAADRVLDWISPGLAEAAAHDYPAVRLWPPSYTEEGFQHTFAANVAIPEPRGRRSHWVLVSGMTQMGKHKLHVGLAFHTAEPNSLRHLRVHEDQWLDVLKVRTTQPAGSH